MDTTHESSASSTDAAAEPAAKPAKGIPPIVFVLFLGMVFSLTVMAITLRRGLGRGELPVMGQVTGFEFVDQSGRTVKAESLRGRVWIAGFIFTRCSGPCPRVTASMATLHNNDKLRQIPLVSFSVDPTHDTPEVLTDYAKNFSVDTRRWRFLTGDKDKMTVLIRGTFKLPIAEAKDGSVPPGEAITHSDRLMLIDRQGRIRGAWDSLDPAAMARLEAAALHLLANPKS